MLRVDNERRATKMPQLDRICREKLRILLVCLKWNGGLIGKGGWPNSEAQ